MVIKYNRDELSSMQSNEKLPSNAELAVLEKYNLLKSSCGNGDDAISDSKNLSNKKSVQIRNPNVRIVGYYDSYQNA